MADTNRSSDNLNSTARTGLASRVFSLFARENAASKTSNIANIPSESEITKETGQDVEIAQIMSAAGFGQYESFDTIIKRKGYKAYEDIMTDAEVVSAIDFKRFSVIGSKWDIIPATDGQDDVDKAAFVRDALVNMDGSLSQTIFGMLSALIYGFSLSEMNFALSDRSEYAGKWMLKNIRTKNLKDYFLVLDEYGNTQEIKLQPASGAKISVPAWKYITYVYRQDKARPFGTSDLRAVYRHWWSKDFLMKWWNVYLERFGGPLRVGKYPRAQANNKTKLKEVLRDILNNSAITLPDDMTVEFISVSDKGDFKPAIDYHDAQIRKAILGSTLSTGESQKAGSYALGNVHADVTGNFIDFLRADIAELIRERIIRTLLWLNYGTTDRLPSFVWEPRRREIAISSVGDIQTLVNAGVLINRDVNILRKRLDLPDAEAFAGEDAGEPLSRGTSGNVDTGSSVDNPPAEEPTTTPIGTPLKNDGLDDGTGDGAKSENAAHIHTPAKYQSDSDIANWEPWRALYKCEERMGGVSYFKASAAKQKKSEDELISNISGLMDSARDSLLSFVQNKVVVDNELVRTQLDKLAFPVKEKAKIGKTIVDAVRKTALDTYITSLKKTGRNEKSIPDASKFEAFARLNITVEQKPNADLIKKVKEWRDTEDWKPLKSLREKKIDNVMGSQETRAKTVILDSIESDIVGKTKIALIAGLESGNTIDKISKSISDVFEKYIEHPEAINDKVKSASEVEKLVRTSMTRVVSEADRAVWTDPDVMLDFPYTMYSAIMDDRTSDICIDLDGLVYAADDPIWMQIEPPNHAYCRSKTIPVAWNDPEAEKGPSKQPYDVLSKIPESFGGDKAAKQ